MINFFHRLFNPHCPECQEENSCKSCETLRMQLDTVNRINKELIDHLFPMKPESDELGSVPEMIKPKLIPWKVKQQMLESEDRRKAILMRQAESNNKIPDKKEIEELEKEIGIIGETK